MNIDVETGDEFELDNSPKNLLVPITSTTEQLIIFKTSELKNENSLSAITPTDIDKIITDDTSSSYGNKKMANLSTDFTNMEINHNNSGDMDIVLWKKDLPNSTSSVGNGKLYYDSNNNSNFGIMIKDYSSKNSIVKNTACLNLYQGIQLEFYCDYNNISQNKYTKKSNNI